MRGIRAIRVGVILGGLLALTASSGCCECCRSLWGTKSGPPPKAETQQDEQTIKEWKRTPADWGFKDEKTLTPERVHGGIY